MEIGKYNVLKVNRRTDNGLYLLDEQTGEEVLLPNKFVSDKMEEGTRGKAFVYRDSEDRPVATTQKPLVTAYEAAYLTVKEQSPIGAFLDWGLDKDLLLPFSEQKSSINPGARVLVFVYVDRANGRIVATENLNKFINNKEVNLQKDQEVSMMVADKNQIGYRVIIENRNWGMIYDNEIFTPVKSGDYLTGFIKKLREDGKIDVALQKQGIVVADDVREVILQKLRDNNGQLNLSDHSTPDEIYAALGISKKNFKKAIGMLYKEKKIQIGEGDIRLAKSNKG
ncbi:MAG: S1-like domain-containing RNA-binding protein [Chitinophagales bacterium]